MPEALGAPAGAIAGLLVPVVLLMFVALRLRKKLVYPHQLLYPRPASAPSAALLRSLRLHHDTAIDAACAVIVGLAITGFPPASPWRGDAVVLDTSASMLAGMRGDRPLDEAARLIAGDDALRAARLYILGWDPSTRTHTLRDAGKQLQSSGNPIEMAAEIESVEAFMSADYSLVAELAVRGYKNITLVTDNAAVEGRGVTIRLLHTGPARYCYPASSAWDETTGRSSVRFVTAGGAGPEVLWRLSPDGRLQRPRPGEYAITDDDAGFKLSFREPGLWALGWDGRFTPFAAPAAPPPLAAEGPMAESIVGTLRGKGAYDTGVHRGLVIRERGGAGKQGFLSVGRAEEEAHVLPPRLTLGAVVAAGFDPSLDLALGQASFASQETAAVFYLARDSQATTTPDAPRRLSRPVRIGEGFVYPTEDVREVAISIPPIDEYTHAGARIIVGAGIPHPPRLLIAVLLGLLYGLKLAAAHIMGKQGQDQWT